MYCRAITLACTMYCQVFLFFCPVEAKMLHDRICNVSKQSSLHDQRYLNEILQVDHLWD